MTFENGEMIVGNENKGNGKIAIEFIYVCSANCYSCSKNDECNVCISGYFFFNNKCYADCTVLNDRDKGKYYGKGTNGECGICSIPNCIDCSSNYSRCNKCSNKYEYDNEINQYVLRPTSVFTKSQILTLSKSFSETKGITKSSDFSNSVDFTKSQVFTLSKAFSESKGFTKSSDFSNSNDFTKSQVFTLSKSFSETKRFTKSSDFSNSVDFVKSFAFTKLEDLSGSLKFSNYIIFSDSTKRTESEKLSKSFTFSESEDFSRLSVFSRSVKFSNSIIFSESILSARSTEFIESNKIEISRDFSKFSFSNSEKSTESDKFSFNLNLQ